MNPLFSRLKSKTPASKTIVLALLALPALCATTDQPLSLHPANPRYFLFRGKPAILITSGEHYGAVLNLDFDYIPYLDELHAHGLNHTRTFSGTYREVPSSFGITENTLAPKPNRYIAPWARSTTAGYFDGGNKFDLARWDESYFRRLTDFVTQAAKRGIVVEMNLFCPLYEDQLWQANPMNDRNNVNGIGKCPSSEVYTLAHEDLTRTQKAVTRKIVETLREFDNVYYEVCNEPWCGNVAMAWQNEIISTVVGAESSLPARHLVSLNTSRLKITEPNPAVSIFNFHYAAPADVMALNYDLGKALGDNETGFRGKDNFAYRTEAWDCVVAGGALFSSLDYSFTASHPDGSFLNYQSPGGGNAVLRGQLRILKDFIHGFDFVRMSPDDSVIKVGVPTGFMSGRVLAEKGRAYAVYLRARTDADRFSIRWTGLLAPMKDETCTFHVVSNHGVRLWVNNQLIVDHSRSHEKLEDQGQVTLQAGQKATVRMESYQAKAGSITRLLWSSPSMQKELVPSSRLTPPDGTGQGLKGEYFEDRQMKKLICARNDPAVDFDWSKADPFCRSQPEGPLNLKLELPPGAYRAEWIDPKTGERNKSEDFGHAGGDKTLASPVFTEDIALKLVARN
jgi:hypothetical protein